MSKIDLSKVKIGDKFRTRGGRILTLAHQGHKYTLIGRGCFVRLNQNGKLHEDNEESKFDLIEQVFDNGDILDIGERGEVLAEMTKSEFEKAKELGIDFLQVYIEKNPEEDNPELQRRQEVVELADRIFTEKYLQEWYQYLIDNKTTKTDYVTYIFEWAEKFVNAKDKYLKEGKL